MIYVADVWQRIDQLIFSLMPDGYRKGQPTFKNKVMIQISFDSSVTPAEQKRITEDIFTAVTLRVDTVEELANARR